MVNNIRKEKNMPTQLGDIKLYSLKEISETLKVTEVTLRSYLNSGRLRGQKMGTRWFVTENNLREYFKDNGKPETKKKISLHGITKNSAVTDKDIEEVKQI